MQGIVKNINYDQRKIYIASSEIRHDITYKFNTIQDMKKCEEKLLANFDIKYINGEFNINKIKFNDLILEDINVKHIIANGSNAVVYEGYDEFFERNVAIKVWLPNYVKGKSNKTRFREEVKKMAQINEKSIIRLYNRGNIIGFNYVVMELSNGKTLEKWLSLKPSFYERYKVLKKIIECIENIHSKGIYHGDLHTKNILIIEKVVFDPEFKKDIDINLIDFGTSVFSGKESSKMRESSILFETSFKLIPEIEELGLLDINDYSSIPPMLTLMIIKSAVQVVAINNMNYINENAIIDIALLTSITPFYNLESIFKIFDKYVDKEEIHRLFELYIEYFAKYLNTLAFNIGSGLISDTSDNKVFDFYKHVKEKFKDLFISDDYKNTLYILNEVTNYQELLNGSIFMTNK